jgi:hypothetical protein
VIGRFLGLYFFHEMEALETAWFEAVESHAVTAEVGNLFDLLIRRSVNDAAIVTALMCIAFSGDLAGQPISKRGIALRLHIDCLASNMEETMSEERLAEIPPADPTEEATTTEEALALIRQQAMALIAKVDPILLDQIHAVIKGTPAVVGTATIAAVLADILCFVSKTEDGLGKNVLLASEAILRMATAGLKNRPARTPAGQLIAH